MQQLEIKEAVALVALYPYWAIRDPNGIILSTNKEDEELNFEESITTIKTSKVYPAVQVCYGQSSSNSSKVIVILDSERMIKAQNQAMPFMGIGMNNAYVNSATMSMYGYNGQGMGMEQGGFFGAWNPPPSNGKGTGTGKNEGQNGNQYPAQMMHPYEALMAGMDARMKEQQATFQQQLTMMQVQSQANIENQKLEFLYALFEKDKEGLEKEKERLEEEKDKMQKSPLNALGAFLAQGATRYIDQNYLGGYFTKPLAGAEESEDEEYQDQDQEADIIEEDHQPRRTSVRFKSKSK